MTLINCVGFMSDSARKYCRACSGMQIEKHIVNYTWTQGGVYWSDTTHDCLNFHGMQRTHLAWFLAWLTEPTWLVTSKIMSLQAKRLPRWGSVMLKCWGRNRLQMKKSSSTSPSCRGEAFLVALLDYHMKIMVCKHVVYKRYADFKSAHFVYMVC